MTDTHKNDIIEILEFQKSMLGVDKENINKLIGVINFIKCAVSVDKETKQSIKNMAKKCCKVLNYDMDSDDNYTRKKAVVEVRRAVSYFLFVTYGENTAHYPIYPLLLPYWRRNAIDKRCRF
jgi:hypothetical protein